MAGWPLAGSLRLAAWQPGRLRLRVGGGAAGGQSDGHDRAASGSNSQRCGRPGGRAGAPPRPCGRAAVLDEASIRRRLGIGPAPSRDEASFPALSVSGLVTGGAGASTGRRQPSQAWAAFRLGDLGLRRRTDSGSGPRNLNHSAPAEVSESLSFDDHPRHGNVTGTVTHSLTRTVTVSTRGLNRTHW